MAFSAVFEGFACVDVVCVIELAHFTCRSKWYVCLGLDMIPGPRTLSSFSFEPAGWYPWLSTTQLFR